MTPVPLPAGASPAPESRHRRRARIALGVSATVLLLGAAGVRFRIERVNAELAHSVRGLVGAQAITPDGSRVVYVADYRFAGVNELFVSMADGSGGIVRLSGDLVEGGDVQSFVLSLDGTRVMYRADQDVDGVVELYGAPVDGSAPAAKLNGTLASNPLFLQFAPDGSRIVFKHGNAVYTAPSDGSAAPVKLNPPLVAGGIVQTAWVSPDSSRVVYRADQVTNEVYELFSVPIDGGAAVRLNGTLVAGGDVATAGISPDSAWVVYTADEITDGKEELFGVPIGGGTSVRLNGVPMAGSSILGFEVVDGPVVPRVVYRAEEDVLGARELHVVPADGSAAPLEVSPPVAPGAGVASFQVTADGAHAVQLLQTGELHAAPLDGSSPAVRLSAPLPAGIVVDGFALTPDGARAVYWTRVVAGGSATEIHSVPVDGSAGAVLLSGISGADRLSFSPAISPDGSRVVYLRANASLYDLWSAPVDGSQAAVRVNGSLPYVRNGLYPQHFAFDGKSTSCLFMTWQTPNFDQLYRAPLDGSAEPTWLSTTAQIAEVTAFQVSADGSRAVFAVALLAAPASELHAVDTDGTSPSVRVTDPLPNGPWQGDVTEFVLTDDASRAVYVAPQDVHGQLQPYVATLDGSEPVRILDGQLGSASKLLLTPDGSRAVWLFQPLAAGITFQSFRVAPLDGGAPPLELPGDFLSIPDPRVTPDSARVVFRTVDIYDDGTLFALPLDGSAPPVALDSADVKSDHVASPDSTTVFYRRGPDIVSFGSIELRRVAADGSGAPLVLNGPLVGGGDVHEFRLAGERIVYRADQAEDERDELWSVASGGGPAVRLNAPLVAGGDVLAFTLSPDGEVAVYRADQDVDDVVELYAVPTDGSAAPIELSPALVAGGDVFQVEVTAGGTRVVYLADQTSNDVYELHSVPLDGSAPAVRISGAMVAGGDVFSGFALTPDGTRALYLADALLNGRNELFSVAVTGGPVARLSGDLVAAGDVVSFAVSGDAQWVVYLADADVDGTNELFRARADGTGGAQRISGPLVEGGSVGSGFVGLPVYRVSHDGGTVLFAADKREDERFELFAVTPYPHKYRAAR